ncbi:MAG TPA: hypothetical protein VME18_13760 [Acidobacteriaceae bacterium]|nr:hypothetical protein [Acidobacteriaceae bacterium]
MTDLSKLRTFFRGLSLAAMLSLFSLVPGLLPAAHAQDHLVSPQALQQQAQAATTSRQQNIQTLTKFFSTPIARQAMKTARVDPVEVRNAIPTLSSQQLASLASRATKAQQQFSAGILGTGMLLVIIIAVAVVIIVIAVH